MVQPFLSVPQSQSYLALFSTFFILVFVGHRGLARFSLSLVCICLPLQFHFLSSHSHTFFLCFIYFFCSSLTLFLSFLLSMVRLNTFLSFSYFFGYLSSKWTTYYYLFYFIVNFSTIPHSFSKETVAKKLELKILVFVTLAFSFSFLFSIDTFLPFFLILFFLLQMFKRVFFFLSFFPIFSSLRRHPATTIWEFFRNKNEMWLGRRNTSLANHLCEGMSNYCQPGVMDCFEFWATNFSWDRPFQSHSLANLSKLYDIHVSFFVVPACH